MLSSKRYLLEFDVFLLNYQGINCVAISESKANPTIKFDRIKTHYGTGCAWTPKLTNV